MEEEKGRNNTGIFPAAILFSALISHYTCVKCRFYFHQQDISGKEVVQNFHICTTISIEVSYHSSFHILL